GHHILREPVFHAEVAPYTDEYRACVTECSQNPWQNLPYKMDSFKRQPIPAKADYRLTLGFQRNSEERWIQSVFHRHHALGSLIPLPQLELTIEFPHQNQPISRPESTLH